jgi:hypothetical protein
VQEELDLIDASTNPAALADQRQKLLELRAQIVSAIGVYD